MDKENGPGQIGKNRGGRKEGEERRWLRKVQEDAEMERRHLGIP